MAVFTPPFLQVILQPLQMLPGHRHSPSLFVVGPARASPCASGNPWRCPCSCSWCWVC